jgi:hypothetical protein
VKQALAILNRYQRKHETRGTHVIWHVHVLDAANGLGGRYHTTAYGIPDPDDPLDRRYVSAIAPVTALPGLRIDLTAIF